jgi:DNA-directed RNA polymerase subunit M
MVPKKVGKKTVLVCRNCGKKKEVSSRKEFKLGSISSKKESRIVIVDKKSQVEVFPKTQTQCPKCENTEAFWWVQQTRSGDEPPTRFFKCTKCGHVWREYQ